MSLPERMQKLLDMAETKTVYSVAYDHGWDERGDEHPTVTLYFTDDTALEIGVHGVSLWLSWPEKPKENVREP